jgi:hypothetical protein
MPTEFAMGSQKLETGRYMLILDGGVHIMKNFVSDHVVIYLDVHLSSGLRLPMEYEYGALLHVVAIYKF